jgi:hypothetical protein
MSLAIGAALVFFQSSSVSAVVIDGGDGSGNTTPPPSDPGFNSVASYSDGGAVYLGNGWLLTAGHVYNNDPTAVAGLPNAGGFFYPDGTVYAIKALAGSANADADLEMVHLQTYPALPAMTIASTAPPIYTQVTSSNSAEVTGIGWGFDREPTELYWNSSWQQQTGPSNYAGYDWNTSATAERWGTSAVVGSYTGDDGTGTTTSFLYTQFSTAGGANNMQAASHDSGGGVFYNNGTGWTLAGILLAIGIPNSNYNGQPAGTAVFGDLTYFANLSVYATQIEQEVLSNALPGDANLDGRVDINDLTVVLSNYGQTGAWAQGNFITGDSKVDINDLTILLAHYGDSVSGTVGAGAGPAAVPEPAAIVMLSVLIPLAGWAIGRRRAKTRCVKPV